MTMNHPTMPTTLTRTQRAALDDLLRTGRQWPKPRGRRYGGYDEHVRYSARTLDALVDAGVARWIVTPIGDGVMPHVVPLTADNRGA